MMYSCFAPRTGLYDYFESPEATPLNADLPIPRLPAEVNGIGVPSIVAGRPLPAGARIVGRGWHPRGMVAQCGRTPMGDADGATGSPFTLVAALAMMAVAFYFVRRTA